MRTVCVSLHRYVGLAMAVFLVIAGLTGSLLVFYHELDAWLNPQMMLVETPSPSAKRLDPLVLRERVAAALPDREVSFMPLELDTEPGYAVYFYVRTSDSGIDDEFFVNPYTGEILGSRRHGEFSWDVKDWMPFLYRFHYSLCLGTVGSYLFGIVALLWTIDCFVGAYLTFPPRRKAIKTEPLKRPRSWWNQWAKSWLVKTGSFYKSTFTWHQASGLWVWAMLFVFAWSGVGLNLIEVYNPVMATTFGMPKGKKFPARLESPQNDAELSWNDALRTARSLAATEGLKEGFEVFGEKRLNYFSEYGSYRYLFKSSLDIDDRGGSTMIWFDGDTGELTAFYAPTGQNTGSTIHSWLRSLHFAAVWGTPFQVFVCLMGLLIAILSISGVYIWWVKRRSRRTQSARNSVAEETLVAPQATTASDPLSLQT